MILVSVFFYLVKWFLIVLIGAGLVIVFIVVIFLFIILYKIKNKDKTKYEPRDLAQPFKEYLQSIVDKQLYSECNEVNEIIARLENGDLPQAVNNFIIKKEVELRIIDIDDGSKLKLDKIYKVIGRKNK